MQLLPPDWTQATAGRKAATEDYMSTWPAHEQRNIHKAKPQRKIPMWKCPDNLKSRRA